MGKVHKLVKIEEQTQNMPQFRFYVECECGFQSRVGTLKAAESQFDNHLQYHGCEQYFSKLASTVAEEKPKATETLPPLTPADSSGFTRVGGGLGKLGGK